MDIAKITARLNTIRSLLIYAIASFLIIGTPPKNKLASFRYSFIVKRIFLIIIFKVSSLINTSGLSEESGINKAVVFKSELTKLLA